MLKHMASALLLLGLAFAQQKYSIEAHLDDDGLLPGSKVKCMGEVPQDFACAILFNVDLPFPSLSTLLALLAGRVISPTLLRPQ